MTDDQRRSVIESSPPAAESPEPPPAAGTPPRPAARARPARDDGPGVSAHAAFVRPHPHRSGWRALRTPAAALVIALALTATAAWYASAAASARDLALFRNAVQSTHDRVRARVDTYAALLHGAQALFAASEQVSADEFRTYVDELELETRYAGLQGIGYSRLLDPPGAPSDAASLLRALRAGGSPATRLWPPADSARAQHHAIVYLEPRDLRNRTALGFDMFSEPTRRQAMAAARDSGHPTASGIVTLVQEIETQKQPGFLLYVPVYAAGARPKTVEARRRALRGFVYAPIRAGDFFAGLFGSEQEPRVAFRVFDGRDTTAAALLYDSRDLPPHARPVDALRQLDTVAVGGRTWTLVLAPTAASALQRAVSPAAEILLVGSLAAAALFVVMRAEVRARHDAERSDALRTRFFAAMSHELRTPINAIMGYNDLIVAGLYGPVTDDQQRGIERSQRAARHLLELVNDVLDVSKLEAGKVDVTAEDVELDDLLDDLLVTIQPMAEERACALRLERGCALRMRTDPRRLRQILLNLLSNATKFAAGRPVTVWCEPLAPGSAVPGSEGGAEGGRRWTGGEAVVVAVRDEGPGIAPADHARIFEEFVQLPGATPGGTGLGLPISRRLAELLGGTLTIDSAPGRGSTFFVTLPRVPRRERVRRPG